MRACACPLDTTDVNVSLILELKLEIESVSDESTRRLGHLFGSEEAGETYDRQGATAVGLQRRCASDMHGVPCGRPEIGVVSTHNLDIKLAKSDLSVRYGRTDHEQAVEVGLLC